MFASSLALWVFGVVFSPNEVVAHPAIASSLDLSAEEPDNTITLIG